MELRIKRYQSKESIEIWSSTRIECVRFQDRKNESNKKAKNIGARWDSSPRGENFSLDYGPFINSVTRDAAFFDSELPLPPPLVTLTFPRVSSRHAVFYCCSLNFQCISGSGHAQFLLFATASRKCGRLYVPQTARNLGTQQEQRFGHLFGKLRRGITA